MQHNKNMETQIPRTVPCFVAYCKANPAADLYELFEFEIEAALRDDILLFADRDSPEPVRAAFRKLGRMHDIATLRDY